MAVESEQTDKVPQLLEAIYAHSDLVVLSQSSKQNIPEIFSAYNAVYVKAHNLAVAFKNAVRSYDDYCDRVRSLTIDLPFGQKSIKLPSIATAVRDDDEGHQLMVSSFYISDLIGEALIRPTLVGLNVFNAEALLENGVTKEGLASQEAKESSFRFFRNLHGHIFPSVHSGNLGRTQMSVDIMKSWGSGEPLRQSVS